MSPRSPVDLDSGLCWLSGGQVARCMYMLLLSNYGLGMNSNVYEMFRNDLESTWVGDGWIARFGVSKDLIKCLIGSLYLNICSMAWS